jgi:aminoglycoside phosphotransferase (APT) family kinase protein
MDANMQGFHGPLNVEQFKGGQSNPAFRLVTPNRAYFMRRKPPGPLLNGAHAVDREAHVLKAPGEAGFPAPKIYRLCTDESVLGTRFYVRKWSRVESFGTQLCLRSRTKNARPISMR